ncbi:efflux RND transporter periplasmic adaptor subunit [Ottowia thiooxydans]|uniref:efflux RND transporter periplasmic adaptor subunit n=1 Tax=Ottowia thiooxydans TaxID=219182 RepID=UPI0009FC7D4D|nr:efflux RND transporter periplasmic adaptor subunit [Ottowia thiooxydans]
MHATPSDSPAAASAAQARPRRRWLSWLVGLTLTALLVGGAWWLVQRSKAPAPGPSRVSGGPPPGAGGGRISVTVGSATARLGELPVYIEALGTVTPVVTVALKPQVSGVLMEVRFTEGQLIKKGDVLAVIDPRPFEQALAQTQGQRARDEAQLAAARVTLQRYETLWKQDSIARQDVDTQAALVKQLEGTVQSDRASEDSAKLNVSYTRVTSPITGRVGLRAVDPGNMMQAGSTTIATLTQMTPIDVQFAVPQDRVPDVLAAQRVGSLPVVAFDRTRTKVLERGSFSTLDNVVDTTTGTVKAKARFANADSALFPAQFVNTQLQLGSASGILVPVTAVRTGPKGDYVYVIDGDRVARMQSVKRGLATADQIQIVSGLEGGELVVTEGGDAVKDGARVQLAGDRPAGGASGAGFGGRRSRATPASGAAAAQAPASVSRPQARIAESPGAAAAVAPASAASMPAWFDRLPPQAQQKLLAMPPDERRAYLDQLRERRRAQTPPRE